MRIEELESDYAFELPTDYRCSLDIRDYANPNMRIYRSDKGLIRIIVGTSEPSLTDLARRKQYFEANVLNEAKIITLTAGTKMLGRENNVVYAEDEKDSTRTCIVSAIHQDRHFIIQFEDDFNSG